MYGVFGILYIWQDILLLLHKFPTLPLIFQVSSALCWGKGARDGGEEKEEPAVPKSDDGRGLLGRDLFLEEEPIVLEVNGQEVKGWKHVLHDCFEFCWRKKVGISHCSRHQRGHRPDQLVHLPEGAPEPEGNEGTS